MRLYNESLLMGILNFIQKYQLRCGTSPSYRKIMDEFPAELTSLSKVYRYINVLLSRGLIKKEEGQICIASNIAVRKTVPAPLVSSIACGTPSFAAEDIEQVYGLPVGLFGDHELFMLRAKGASMINAGISNGDLVVIKKQNYADYGQIVVALMGDEATLKTYQPEKNGIVLHPENEEFSDITVSPDDCIIQGVAVGCIKTFS